MLLKIPMLNLISSTQIKVKPVNPITGNQITSSDHKIQSALGQKTELTMTDSYHNLLIITHKLISGSKYMKLKTLLFEFVLF